MELERRDDDQWHLAIANCGCGGAPRESIETEPDDVFTHEDDELYLRGPTEENPRWCDVCRTTVIDRYAQASDAIEHWKLTTTYHDIDWNDYDGAIDWCGWCQSDVTTLVHDHRTDTIICEVCAALYNSSATDIAASARITDHVQLADEVEPIVVIDTGANQRSAAQIDRRPYISLKLKRKYVTVTVTLTHVNYQFTDEAISRLQDIFGTYESRAFQQSDNKGGVEFEISDPQSWRECRPRQQIVVDGLFEDHAREFIEEIIPLVRQTTNWMYDPADVSAQATRQTIRERGRPGPAPVPRENATELNLQDDGLARHAPLSDKSITDSQIRRYVSDQAYRHGEALVDAGRIRANPTGGHKGDADGYEVRSGIGFELWFENGEIVDHECCCGSSLDPCEHIAGTLIALPQVAACYV